MPRVKDKPLSTKTKRVVTYVQLRDRVRAVIRAGKQRALRAVEREKVRTAWETGKLILEHILLNKKRADYGGKVIIRLSKDLGISETELKYSRQFAETYPIRPLTDELPWSHYRDLLAINDDKKRNALAKRAAKEDWNQKRVRAEIRKLKKGTSTGARQHRALTARQGIPYTYRIVSNQGVLKIDLGFSNYLNLSEITSRKLKSKTLIHVKRKARKRYSLSTRNLKATDLFTYSVSVINVVDADTLWVYVDLGFGITTEQKLRLRGINAPEINTRAGLAAKAFVEKALKKAKTIFISTTKSDKYDRYLADIWHDEKYLNQELIDNDHAMRLSE